MEMAVAAISSDPQGDSESEAIKEAVAQIVKFRTMPSGQAAIAIDVSSGDTFGDDRATLRAAKCCGVAEACGGSVSAWPGVAGVQGHEAVRANHAGDGFDRAAWPGPDRR